MAFDSAKFRQLAAKAGYKTADIDKALTGYQNQQAQIQLAQQGVLDPAELAKTDPQVALKAAQLGVKPKPTEEATAAGNLEKDLSLFEKNLNESELRGKFLGGKINLPFGLSIAVPSDTGLTPEAADFDSQRSALAYSLATVLAGQKGQGVSDKDVKNFEKLLPSRGDTNKEATNKLNNIRQMLANRTGNQPTQTTLPADKPGLLSNAGRDAKDILNSVLNLPKTIDEGARNLTASQRSRPTKPWDLGAAVGGAGQDTMEALKMVLGPIAGEYNQLAGDPLAGGDVLGRAAGRAYEKPVTTALDVLPFMSMGKFKPPTNMGKAPLTAAVESAPKGRMGGAIRQGVRDIDVGPSVYGPGREARINQTMNNLNIKGSPAQQYSQLEPRMAQLSDEIFKELVTEPKSVSIDDIVDDFDKNLNSEGIYRTGQLTRDAAQKEARQYIQDVYNSAKGGQDVVPSKIDTPDLFELKKSVNQDYKGVKKKIDNGTPLTDKDKVIAVARQTLDDIIASKHPSVKEKTLMQSDLYDAAESLHKKRGKASSLKLPFGIDIPVPQTVAGGGQDAIGRLLQRVGL